MAKELPEESESRFLSGFKAMGRIQRRQDLEEDGLYDCPAQPDKNRGQALHPHTQRGNLQGAIQRCLLASLGSGRSNPARG